MSIKWTIEQTKKHRKVVKSMSFMSLDDLNSIPDLELLPAGQIVTLRVKDARLVERKKNPGTYGFQIYFEDPSNPNSSDVFHYICYPDENDTKNAKAMFKDQMKSFLSHFNVTLPPIDPATAVATDEKGYQMMDWIGATGQAVLKVEEDQRTPGKMVNSVEKFVK